MLEVIGQDYIRTARAKGCPRAVILKHGLRNALIPIITLFAGFLPGMLGGSVLIEVIFGIPGMGRLSFDSILQRDFPTLMALIYINAIVVMISILLTDLLYVVADPRISFQGRGQTLMAKPGEAYLDIVWKQFKKNRFALAALWALLPVALMALFAPLIASDQPLVYFDGTRCCSPGCWLCSTRRRWSISRSTWPCWPSVPWVVLAWWLNRRWQQGEVPGRCGCCASWAAGADGGRYHPAVFDPGVRPSNPHSHRAFVEEEFRNPDARGIYTLIPYGPRDQERGSAYQPPLFRKAGADRQRASEWFPHLLGTDDIGRDVLARMIYGTRISLTIGFLAVGIYLTIGIIVGALAGYFGGMTDILISRVIEVILLFPSFFLILTWWPCWAPASISSWWSSD
jgi:ABC-type dipeptide/oligopeptide/nickel transport system permease subunit